MRLNEVVPYGRCLDEYRRMFCLTEEDISRKILGVGDGPASFNAEMRQMGRRVISVDPIYVFSAQQIADRFHAIADDVIAQVEATPNDWVWTYHRSPQGLRETRVAALNRFVADYDAGRAEGRYLIGELPRLAFADGEFDIALCSHFLFLYSDHFDYTFHRDSILELLRIAKEARFFPLLTLMLERSPHLRPLLDDLKAAGFQAEVRSSGYELQRGGHEMLRVFRAG